MEVIVPDDFLSVAIGKRGQNVRLASKLTGWHLDVKSESRYSEAMQKGYDSLLALPGIGISMADALYEKGIFSTEELSQVTIEELTQIRGISDQKAAKLIEYSITSNETAASGDVNEPDGNGKIDTDEQTPADDAEIVETVEKPESEDDAESPDSIEKPEPVNDAESPDSIEEPKSINDAESPDSIEEPESEDDAEIVKNTTDPSDTQERT
jgi:N utilization substance protein A